MPLSPKAVRADAAHRIEQTIGVARTLVAVASLSVIAITPRTLGPFADELLILYTCYSLAVMWLMGEERQHTRPFKYAIHLADVLWPAIIGLFPQGPNGLVFLFYLFVLFAAAFRWGVLNTAVTVVLMVGVLWTEVLAGARGLLAPAAYGAVSVEGLLASTVQLVITGALAGYIGHVERQLREENIAISCLLAQTRTDRSFGAIFASVVYRAMALIGVGDVVLLCERVDTHRAFLWTFRYAPCKVRCRELSRAETPGYSVKLPVGVWRASRRPKNESGAVLLALEEGNLKCTWPPFLTDFPWRTGLVGTFRAGEWAIRFFFLQNGRIRNPQLMQRILDQVVPSIHNAYLLHEMLDQAAYLEREKIARELHDGTIQLLFGLEMQLDVLQRRAAPDAALATELKSMQHVIHQELLNLRDLIQGAKTFQVTPDEFDGFVREIVEKFARDSRIKAEFVCDIAPPLPSVDQCRELARIVHETLVNIRKHSGAKNILVRFTSEFDRWRLTIEDDGKGFDFSGRLSLAELDAWHAGPAVIRDCAHRLRAHLTIQSTPNQGARLEVSLGRDIRAAFKVGAAQAGD